MGSHSQKLVITECHLFQLQIVLIQYLHYIFTSILFPKRGGGSTQAVDRKFYESEKVRLSSASDGHTNHVIVIGVTLSYYTTYI